MAPPVGPFGYIVACHHLALPFNILCSPVQALPALIRFALQTCAPILLSQTGPLGQQGEPQKKRGQAFSLFFGGSPCWTRTNDLAVNSRSLLPTELRRIIILSVLCGIRSLLATSGPLVTTRIFAKSENSLFPSRSALGYFDTPCQNFTPSPRLS